MDMPVCKKKVALVFLSVLSVAFLNICQTQGADHADTEELISLERHDARLTDLYAFRRDDNLVLALCIDPNVPTNEAGYSFPPDLTLRFHIDNHSEVDFNDPDDYSNYGGTVVWPTRVSEDILFEITFSHGEPLLSVEGLHNKEKNIVLMFTGLRDDPFIRTPRFGKNVAAVVLEMPLSTVLDTQPTILIWATSKVPDIRGPISDHAGRALRSQFEEQLNTKRPRDHGEHPDVIIFNTSYQASFPNGRELEDDVVHLIPNPIIDDATQNDLPFLEEFPYLAEPHVPTP